MIDIKEDETANNEFKVYKEKPYLNSDKDPFGLTINGKSKEYILAHDAVKDLIKKGKQYTVDEGKMKILDASIKKAMVNAIVEVTSVNGNDKGNVELKVYNPSLNKKKGATIELRKMSGFDYHHVDKLKNILTALLDEVIAGGNIEQIAHSVVKNSALKLLG